jgi:ABC-type bacteriocin/lantibiotic exporter with double-glycine peptidase domain
VLRSLAQYLEGFRGAIGGAIFIGLALVLPGIAIPWLLGRFVDEVLVARVDGVAGPLLIGFVVAAVARALLVAIRRGCSWTRSAARPACRRGASSAQALSLPMAFYSQRSAGEIAARVDLNDRVAETISSDFAMLALNLMTASFFLVLMVRLEPRLALLAFSCVALELIAWRALARRTAEISQELSVQGGKLSGMATGGLANIESIKAGGQETALFRKWLGMQVQFLNASIRSQRVMMWLAEAPSLLGLVASLAVLGFGAALIIRGEGFSVGDLVAFQVLLAGFTAPVQGLFSQTQALQSLRGDLSRLDDVLHHKTEPGVVVPGPAAAPAPRLAGALEFRDVTFGYNKGEAPLLEAFSITVRPGGRVAVVGASGSGKSTLARLACRASSRPGAARSSSTASRAPRTNARTSRAR